jgi:hypothetical protein
VCVQ